MGWIGQSRKPSLAWYPGVLRAAGYVQFLEAPVPWGSLLLQLLQLSD